MACQGSRSGTSVLTVQLHNWRRLLTWNSLFAISWWGTKFGPVVLLRNLALWAELGSRFMLGCWVGRLSNAGHVRSVKWTSAGLRVCRAFGVGVHGLGTGEGRGPFRVEGSRATLGGLSTLVKRVRLSGSLGVGLREVRAGKAEVRVEGHGSPGTKGTRCSRCGSRPRRP